MRSCEPWEHRAAQMDFRPLRGAGLVRPHLGTGFYRRYCEGRVLSGEPLGRELPRGRTAAAGLLKAGRLH